MGNTFWDFTADSTSVLKTLRDSDPPREQSFIALSLRMVRNLIYLYEAGQYATSVAFEEIGTIDGVAPTDLQDAYDKIIAIIPQSGGGGGAVSSVNGLTGAVTLTSSDIPDIATTYVPYTGATQDVNLVVRNFITSGEYNAIGTTSIVLSAARQVGSGGLYDDSDAKIIADYNIINDIYNYGNGNLNYNNTTETVNVNGLFTQVKGTSDEGAEDFTRLQVTPYFFEFLGISGSDVDALGKITIEASPIGFTSINQSSDELLQTSILQGQTGITTRVKDFNTSEVTEIRQTSTSFTYNGNEIVTIGVDNPTLVPLLASDLNTTYLNVKPNFVVWCKNISLKYEKTADGTWVSSPILLVV